jgi:hypothetical protein
MSTTSIYRLGRDPCCLFEARNAWRGAMQVWNHVARRYFGLEMFPWSGDMQNKVWGAARTHPLSPEEKIVLLTTMDNAVVRGGDAEAVAAAFDAYGAGHTDSSFREQAEAIRAAIKSGDIQPDDFLAWQQTSVGEFWGRQGWNEAKENWDWYDPNTGDKHFDAYQDATRAQAA